MAYRKKNFPGSPGNGSSKHDVNIIVAAEPVKMGRTARRKLERLERKALLLIEYGRQKALKENN